MVYPSSYDDIGDRGATQADTTTHGTLHDNLAGAVERTQAELGLNPAGSDSTVAARLARLDADGAVGADELDPEIWGPLYSGWVSYTPALQGFGTLGTGGTRQGQWQRVGRTVHFQALVTFGASPTWTGIVKVGLPIAASDNYASGAGMYWDEGQSLKMPAPWNVIEGSFSAAAFFVGGNASPTAGQIGRNGTDYPAAPAAGSRLFLSGTYRCTPTAAGTL